MGTSGRGAGGGSGGSGGGRWGGGGTGAGVLTIRDGSLTNVDPQKEEAWGAIQAVFSRLPQDYIAFLVGDDGVRTAYETIQWLHVIFVQEKSWDKIEQRFQVPPGPNCLRNLIDALSREGGPLGVNPHLHDPLKSALMRFFLKVVGDDPVIRDSGDAKEVLAATSPRAFQSASALFFGAYLADSLRQEEKGLTRLARARLREFSEAKANQVVYAFRDRFRGKPWNDIHQVSFTHLFQVMKAEPEWLSELLRKTVRDQEQA
jgi:hypothetical protein